jgi:AcrR family transcriptional regulator
MLRPDSASRRDMITDNAIALIEESGLTAISFASLAGRIGHSPQAIQKWVGTSAQLMIFVTATFGQRWQQWITRRRYEHGALSLLPETHEELGWTRVRHALEEHARAKVEEHPELAHMFAAIRSCERWVLTTVHPALESPDRVDALAKLLVIVEGLRSGLCRPDDPISVSQARAMLAAACRDHAGPLDDCLPVQAHRAMGMPQVG